MGKNKENIEKRKTELVSRQIWKIRDKYLAAYQESTCSPLKTMFKHN